MMSFLPACRRFGLAPRFCLNILHPRISTQLLASTSRQIYSSQVCRHQVNLQGPTTTLNAKEATHFRALSDSWWTSAEFAPLRSMNQLRVPFISRAFETPESASSSRPLEGVKLLDIGCGGGILSEALARLGADVTGVDPVAENIATAQAHSAISFRNSPNLAPPKYISTTVEELAKDHQNHFDGVIASEVLEHVDNVALFLGSALDCLRPGGRLLLTTINQTPLSYATVIVAAERIGLVPPGTHQYEKFVPVEALRLVLEQDFNCSVRAVNGMAFNPLTGQWSWTQCQWINYAMMAVKNK